MPEQACVICRPGPASRQITHAAGGALPERCCAIHGDYHRNHHRMAGVVPRPACVTDLPNHCRRSACSFVKAYTERDGRIIPRAVRMRRRAPTRIEKSVIVGGHQHTEISANACVAPRQQQKFNHTEQHFQRSPLASENGTRCEDTAACAPRQPTGHGQAECNTFERYRVVNT